MISNRWIRGGLVFLFLAGLSIPATAFGAKCPLLLRSLGALVLATGFGAGAVQLALTTAEIPEVDDVPAIHSAQSWQLVDGIQNKAREARQLESGALRLSVPKSIEPGRDFVSPLTGRKLAFETIQQLGRARTLEDLIQFGKAHGLEFVAVDPDTHSSDRGLELLQNEFRLCNQFRLANGRELTTLYIPPQAGLPNSQILPRHRPFPGKGVLLLHRGFSQPNSWGLVLQHEILHHLLGHRLDRVALRKEEAREAKLYQAASKAGGDPMVQRMAQDAWVASLAAHQELEGSMLVDEWDVFLIQTAYSRALGTTDAHTSAIVDQLVGSTHALAPLLRRVGTDPVLQKVQSRLTYHSDKTLARLEALYAMRVELLRTQLTVQAFLLGNPRLQALVSQGKTATKPALHFH